MTIKHSTDHYDYYYEYLDGEMCYHGEKYVQCTKSSELNYSTEQLKTFLVNIDLSKNHLVGSIPCEIIMLKGLFGLNLSYNNLVRSILAKIGKIEVLESLGLSFNQFSRPISRSIKTNFIRRVDVISQQSFWRNSSRKSSLHIQ
uniref:Uncharacterized protein n=1 Tax=Cucumis melo TaxID=3656 RepID=A0A9I9EC21_CUCME